MIICLVCRESQVNQIFGIRERKTDTFLSQVNHEFAENNAEGGEIPTEFEKEKQTVDPKEVEQPKVGRTLTSFLNTDRST